MATENRAPPLQVMLLKIPARFAGAGKSVMVFSDREADGKVVSTRSSLRNCRRFPFNARLPQSNRWLNPPSESMDWVTSAGLNEFRVTKAELEA